MSKKKYPDLGKYCSYSDAILSATALRFGLLDNTPTEEEFENMLRTYNNIILPIANWLGGIAPGINSFYRSDRPQKKINGIWHSVNSIVGGSPTSDHPNGRAVDTSLRRIPVKQNNIALARFGRDNLEFDQLIIEAVDPVTKIPAWCHFGYRGVDINRKQLIEATFKNGKAKYSFLR